MKKLIKAQTNTIQGGGIKLQ